MKLCLAAMYLGKIIPSNYKIPCLVFCLNVPLPMPRIATHILRLVEDTDVGVGGQENDKAKQYLGPVDA